SFCTPETTSRSCGFKPSCTMYASPTIDPTLIARCLATSLPPTSSATNAKYCPLIRSTETTGIRIPGTVFQMMRARTNCIDRSPQCGLGLLELLLADGAGRVELAGAGLLLPREVDRGFTRGALRLLAGDGRLLPAGIDLDERRSRGDAVARCDEDLGDLTLDL